MKIIASIDQWLDYQHTTRIGSLRYKGQTQKWFLLAADSDEEVHHQIDLATAGELKEWRWMELEDVREECIEFKRGVYSAVVREFRPRIDQIVHTRNSLRL